MARIENETLAMAGGSGAEYVFSVYEFGTQFKPLGGVYVITRRSETGAHAVVYIGQTGDLSDRFDGHHKAPCFARESANCISILLDASKEARLRAEGDLLQRWTPPCQD